MLLSRHAKTLPTPGFFTPPKPLSPIPSTLRRTSLLLPRAQPLFPDVPKSIFPMPQSLFSRPEKLFPQLSVRDFVLNRDEVIQKFPWEAAIIGAILFLVLVEAVFRVVNGEHPDDGVNGRAEEGGGEALTQSADDFENAMQEFGKQDAFFERNRGIVWLSGVTVVALWMAGFLNNPQALAP